MQREAQIEVPPLHFWGLILSVAEDGGADADFG